MPRPQRHLITWLSLAAMLGLAGCERAPTSGSGGRSQTGKASVERHFSSRPPHNPKELGWVHWRRNYDRAATEAKRTGKPIFLLFQEVPGCATCVGFGETVLSHPLVIEAIESAFVPVAIYNNKGGHDGDILNRFHEPAWNNPVVRLVSADGKDLVPRASNIWDTHGIASRMAQALKAADLTAPNYLGWAIEETAPADRATFSMYCYWRGEACLGDIAGVTSSRTGFLGGREVVEVYFDQSQVSEASLRQQAKQRGCGDFVANAKTARDAGEDNNKYHLNHSRLRFLNLTPLQATRVNAALALKQPVERWLSPRQLQLQQQLRAAPATALSNLKRPSQLHALASYEYELRERLAQTAR